jgi:uncharacterized protein (TIGR02246 family)
MKLKSYALSLLAPSCVVSLWAQAQNANAQTEVTPEVKQQIEAVQTQAHDAYNRHDAAALAAFFRDDAIKIGDWMGSLKTGREAIEKDFAQWFTQSSPTSTNKNIAMYAIENEVVTISEFEDKGDQGTFKGHNVTVFFRDPTTPGKWLIRTEFTSIKQVK